MRNRSRVRACGAVLAMLATGLAACVPVTVNITFPQEQLDSAARQIEEKTAQSGPISRRLRRRRSPRRRPPGAGPST